MDTSTRVGKPFSLRASNALRHTKRSLAAVSVAVAVVVGGTALAAAPAGAATYAPTAWVNCVELNEMGSTHSNYVVGSLYAPYIAGYDQITTSVAVREHGVYTSSWKTDGWGPYAGIGTQGFARDFHYFEAVRNRTDYYEVQVGVAYRNSRTGSVWAQWFGVTWFHQYLPTTNYWSPTCIV